MKVPKIAGAALGFAMTAIAPAIAGDVSITLNDAEQRALVQLLDDAVRAQGLNSAQNAVALYQKVLAARNAASTPQPAPSGVDKPQ